MHVIVITLFPEIFKALTDQGVLSKAFSSGLVNLEFINPRDFTQDNHRTVDDRPFGGGPGMVMLAEPLARSIESAKEKLPHAPVVYLSPQGKVFNQAQVKFFLDQKSWIFLCGRYEGIDERVLENLIDLEISIGDFVLSGGELALMCILDAVIRHIPGVLGDDLSAIQDSFSNPNQPDLLDCPHYTRPPIWRGHPVPTVLLSGHHKNIEQWRAEKSLEATQKKREKKQDF